MDVHGGEQGGLPTSPAPRPHSRSVRDLFLRQRLPHAPCETCDPLSLRRDFHCDCTREIPGEVRRAKEEVERRLARENRDREAALAKLKREKDQEKRDKELMEKEAAQLDLTQARFPPPSFLLFASTPPFHLTLPPSTPYHLLLRLPRSAATEASPPISSSFGWDAVGMT